MTLNDFLKRVKDCQKDKMMILVDKDGGWTNTNVEINEKYIKILPDIRPLFNDD